MSGKWDEVDPRVEWAMKIMDTEGEHFDSEVPYFIKCAPVLRMRIRIRDLGLF
jgi:hypothetical protein